VDSLIGGGIMMNGRVIELKSEIIKTVISNPLKPDEQFMALALAFGGFINAYQNEITEIDPYSLLSKKTEKPPEPEIRRVSHQRTFCQEKCPFKPSDLELSETA
jgi:hypothetical protein